MTIIMEAAIYALIGAIILFIIQMMWKNSGEMSSAKTERRSTGRRLDALEEEMKGLRDIYTTLGEIGKDLSHIMATQKEAMNTLTELSRWQAKHQTTIEEAKEFIHESYRDGVRTKE